MGRITRFVVVVAAATLMGAAPAAADIDKNPNAGAFGPAWCEDGQTFEQLYSPGGVVGQVFGTNEMGTNHRPWLVADAEGTKIAPFGPPLSPGLERLTVFCWWEQPGSPTGFFGGDILFGGHGRP